MIYATLELETEIVFLEDLLLEYCDDAVEM